MELPKRGTPGTDLGTPAGAACATLAEIPGAATPEQIDAGARGIAECLRVALRPAAQVIASSEFFKTYLPPEGQKSFSEMTGDDRRRNGLLGMMEPAYICGTAHPLAARFRTKYTDADLDELVRLVELRAAKLLEAERKVGQALVARPRLAEKAAARTDRYAVLKVLVERSADTGGRDTGKAIAVLQRTRMTVPRDLSRFPTSLLHPYAPIALEPDRGAELSALDPGSENPFWVSLAVLSSSADRLNGFGASGRPT